MAGSPVVAAFIGFWGFWTLLLVGTVRGEVGVGRGALFLGLWLGGFVGLRYLPYVGSLFPPYVAILDIALVFLIFKGDVRLT
jgi:hypothetical protein